MKKLLLVPFFIVILGVVGCVSTADMMTTSTRGALLKDESEAVVQLRSPITPEKFVEHAKNIGRDLGYDIISSNVRMVTATKHYWVFGAWGLWQRSGDRIIMISPGLNYQSVKISVQVGDSQEVEEGAARKITEQFVKRFNNM